MLSSGFRRTTAIFGVLRSRELRAFWFSDWVSDAGSFVTFIALAVYVNQLTGSPAAIGLALGLRSIPWFTIGPFAGVLADRLDRRRVMIGSNLARGALVALLPFTTSLWQVYVIALASAAFGPLFRSARSALLPLVAPEGRLVPALAVIETTHQALHTVGPALGGLIVFLVGAREAFFVDAASFVLASGFLVALSPRGRPAREPRSAVHDMAEGIRGVVAAPSVRAYALLNASLSLGYGGLIALLVPYLGDELRRPGGDYGIVLAAMGLGTVLTSLAIASRDDRHPRGPWAVASVAGMAVFLAILARPSFLALLPVAVVAGLGDAGASIPMAATMAEVLPDALRGRAYSAVTAFTELTAAIGSIGFAWLGEPGHVGVVIGMALAAGVGAALGLAALAGGGAVAINRRERIRLSTLVPAGLRQPDAGTSDSDVAR
jgi:NRE family putative nickel resistance protein-like MFS transporter